MKTQPKPQIKIDMSRFKSKKYYLMENELKYSKEEKNAFLESLREYSKFKSEIFRESADPMTGKSMPFSAKLKKIKENIGQMIEAVEGFTLSETQDGFDNITVGRDMKRIKESYKLFEKTCTEMATLQHRLEACYEDIGTGLGRYYDL